MQTIVENSSKKTVTNQIGMCLIPGGKFRMGSTGWGEYESPVHEVHVDDFFIDESPVTNKEFWKFVKETGYITSAEIKGIASGYIDGEMKEIKGLNWKTYFNEKRENHPVVLISWNDANEFAKWSNKRLPTEAEWEKAARGGLLENLYSWGNYEPDNSICNFGKETYDSPPTSEVKSFSANGFGLYDMGGNVWNWCSDWYDKNYYSIGNNINPKGAENGITKIRRGASFNIIQAFRLRCANRGAFDPNNYAINIGFRCVKDFK